MRACAIGFSSKSLTDQAGLFGWGEATLEWHTRSVVGAVEDLATLLIGEDPTRIEHLWQIMHRQHFWHGNGIVRATAIAGIDLALWDILGKVHHVPCHKLWGGPVRDHIRLYAHLGGGRMENFYQTQARRRRSLCRPRPGDRGRGILRLQIHGRARDRSRSRDCAPSSYAEAVVASMRDAVGPDIDIMVDCHARPSPRMGLLFAKALEPYGLYFFEEPCWPESIEGLADIQKAVATPIATGERITNLGDFNRLLEGRACSIIQPDITHCGGLTAARRIAALAEVAPCGHGAP